MLTSDRWGVLKPALAASCWRKRFFMLCLSGFGDCSMTALRLDSEVLGAATSLGLLT